MPATPIPIKSNPGIKRDGTTFEGDFYVDGQWTRFQRGLPRKIGGYSSVIRTLRGNSRGFTNYPSGNFVFCHSGTADRLERFTIDVQKNASDITNRTPVGFPVSENNRWTFDYLFESSTTSNLIIAHVAPNGTSIVNDSGGAIYSGDQSGILPLTPITVPAGRNATGGIVCLHPYLMYYGSAGIIGWSAPGAPSDLSGMGSGVARVWGQKIVKGLPLRAGTGSGPAGIFWAYDAIIRGSFVGGATVFQFDVLTSDSSIMSGESVVDYDGIFYWAGVDRFLMFNGVVREIPNEMNVNWFFENLNDDQRSKVFAFKVTRFGEIWWCYPRGTATECTHAVIFNVREGSWYDTALPPDFRTAGSFCRQFAAPILVGAGGLSTTKAWLHEQAMDAVDGGSSIPIEAYYETADMSAMVLKNASEKLRVSLIEPDFLQSGEMSVQILGRSNARAREVDGEVLKFQDQAVEPQDQVVMLKEQRREMRFRFRSNVLGGNFQAGLTLAHVEPGDKQVLS